MSDLHPLSCMVRDFYNKLNTEVNFLCRLNDADLTKDQTDIYNQLSEEIKKRYYGSGINIPEKLEGKRVLDIGCGSGSLVFILSKLVGPKGSVFGVDMSDGLIDTAKQQSDFHAKLWGYDKPNFEFKVGNIETLDKLGFAPNSFDIVVSNGVFCLVPNKDAAFTHAYNLLKEGGQFYLNDVYAEKDPPEEYRNDEKLWSLGTTGAMRWDRLAEVSGRVGFTTPYLTCAAPVNIVKEEYNKMLGNGRYSCAGWRLFKLGQGAKRDASRVTYNGNISAFPQAFPWDVDLTFPVTMFCCCWMMLLHFPL
ncbi:arsenite methyltransferase-like [Littorina saxatilis]|uniref:arsenite methyltransferase-like n=1 Tax=Littorina saxatilis TaxID=31220 RepID=UPI0038B55532